MHDTHFRDTKILRSFIHTWIALSLKSIGRKIKIRRNTSAFSFCFANCTTSNQALANPNAQLFQISPLDNRFFKESECSPHPQQPKPLLLSILYCRNGKIKHNNTNNILKAKVFHFHIPHFTPTLFFSSSYCQRTFKWQNWDFSGLFIRTFISIK